MIKKTLLSAFATTLFLPTASKGQDTEKILRQEFPNFDILRAALTQTGGMDLDGSPGDLSTTTSEVRAILSKPIELFDGLTMIPFFTYELTQLNFGGTGAIPIGDESLHSAALQTVFFKDFKDSPWLAVGWTRAELATDYQGISSDDFTFDIAAGLAYKFSDGLTLGAGFVVTDINGRERIFPGLNFDWTPTEDIRVGIYGPNLFTRYTMNDAWYLSLEGSPNGGVWNINDDFGVSRNVELNSYLIGLNTHHRVSGEFWMSLGVGYSFANQIEIRDNGPTFSRDLDGAPYAQISFSLRKW